MWAKDLRAITLGDWRVMRRSRSGQSEEELLRRALQDRGIPLPPEAFRPRPSADPLQATIEEPLEARLGHLPHPPADPAGTVEAVVEAVEGELEWQPDALPALDRLREGGYRIGLVADSSVPLGPSWKKRVAPWFDVVVLSRDVGRVKPHRDLFLRALEALHTLPSWTLHVGDRPLGDVAGAKLLGLRAALVRPPPGRAPDWDPDGLRPGEKGPEELPPDLTVRNLEELCAALDLLG